MSNTKRLFALAVLPALLLAGCGDDNSSGKSSSSTPSKASSSSSSSASTLAKPVTNGNLSDVKLDTKDPNKPVVSIDKSKLPFGTKDVQVKVVEEGKGASLGAKDLTRINFVMVNGTTGKTVANSFGQHVSKFDMSQSTQYLPGFIETIKKHKVGSKLLMSVPASKAFGSAGNTQLGVGGNDNLVIYATIDSSAPLLSKVPAGNAPAQDGLPAVSVQDGKDAKITFEKGQKAPNELKSRVLVQGDGETVQKGDTLVAHYTGQIWNGAVFDSSFKHGGKPAEFPIGVGQVIPGWDKALVGKKVGDRVLISIPPADGYGKSGNPQAGIKGTDTLVFVVDILGTK